MALSIFAPAKINLYLNITGKRPNGYHDLDSLITFADIGDVIIIREHNQFEFELDGKFAGTLQRNPEENLVIRALKMISGHLKRPLNFHVTLQKNLPVAAGIGGGSSDAAAAIWGALKLWGEHIHADDLDPILLKLGADVPVCYKSQTQHVQGIGDILEPVSDIAELPILLVNPGKSCPTQDVFMRFKGPISENVILPDNLYDQDTLIDFLANQRNDLQNSACKLVPEIENVLRAMDHTDGVLFSRLSGSGATCFALYKDAIMAKLAAQTIKNENPDWWVKQGWIGRTERY